MASADESCLQPCPVNKKHVTSKTKHLNSKTDMWGKWHLGYCILQARTAFRTSIFNHAISCHFVKLIKKKHAYPSHAATLFFEAKSLLDLLTEKKEHKFNSTIIYIHIISYNYTYSLCIRASMCQPSLGSAYFAYLDHVFTSLHGVPKPIQ